MNAIFEFAIAVDFISLNNLTNYKKIFHILISMINTIFFDVGGVILNLEGSFQNLLEFIKPENPKEFWQEFNILAVPACQGKQSFNDFLRDVAKKYGKNISDNSLDDLWMKNVQETMKINSDVVNIIKKLKKQNYKLGVISNTIKEISEVSGSHPEDMVGKNIFDVILSSHELGIAKPQKEIFELAMKKIYSKPEECVFIDDVQKYVNVADSLGINGILFTDAEDLDEKLKELNVLT
ncbi:HAD family phosphatase [archaeon]|jgi:epoxide hydrolase-like predicted phosphatase|nr:HAD family phosphatase [archaeon]